MSDFSPNCVRFVVYGGVQIINSNGSLRKYVTIYRKRALVAQITQIELLVPLECAF